jgi:ribosomal-protein-alanine N-acetyltransferase
MILRPARLDEAALLHEIEAAAVPQPWSVGMYRDSLEQGHRSLVLEEDGEVRGFAVWMQVLEDEAELLNIVMRPHAQGRGLGRQLLRAVLETARTAGTQRLMLEVRESNASARRLYLRNGFIENGIRKNYYRTATGHEHAILMEIAL